MMGKCYLKYRTKWHHYSKSLLGLLKALYPLTSILSEISSHLFYLLINQHYHVFTAVISFHHTFFSGEANMANKWRLNILKWLSVVKCFGCNTDIIFKSFSKIKVLFKFDKFDNII